MPSPSTWSSRCLATAPPPLGAHTPLTYGAHLAERGSAPGPLFVTRTGARLQRSYVLDLLQRLAGAVGVPDPHTLTPHAIRHSVATALLHAGEPLDVVQALLGHADPRTTQAYLHVDQLDRSPAHRAGRRLATVVALRFQPRGEGAQSRADRAVNWTDPGEAELVQRALTANGLLIAFGGAAGGCLPAPAQPMQLLRQRILLS